MSNTYNGGLRTYIITLGESEDVKKKLDYLGSRGIRKDTITVVPGVRVNSSNVYKLNDNTNAIRVSEKFAKYGPYSVIGCALAHMKAWNTFLSDPSLPEWGIIFEDDVIMPDNTNRFIERVQELVNMTPTDFDILYLGTMGSEGSPNLFTVAMSLFGILGTQRRINNKIKQPNVALAMHGYVLSRRGVQKLLDYLNGHVNFHIDFCMQKLASEGKIKAYAASPRIVYQTSTNTCQSENLSLSSSHPLLLTKFISNFHIDDYVRADYPLRVSILRVGETDINLNGISILFLVAGIICAYRNIDIILLAYIFIFLSIPDIVIGLGRGGNGILLIHFILFIGPSVISNFNK